MFLPSWLHPSHLFCFMPDSCWNSPCLPITFALLFLDLFDGVWSVTRIRLFFISCGRSTSGILRSPCMSILIPCLAYEFVHGLCSSNSILDSRLGSLDKTSFSLISTFIFLIFSQLVQLPYTDTLLPHSFLPDLQAIISLFLLSFALFLSLLHAEYLS